MMKAHILKLQILGLLFIGLMYWQPVSVNAQDGYYGKPSTYVPNAFEPNIVFNFDYKMTGTISSGRRHFPFTIYVNTADGSWAVTDNILANMLGRSTATEDEKFDFLVHLPNEVTRIYSTIFDPDEGEKKVFYSLNRVLSAPAAQLEFIQEANMLRFMQNATKTNAGRHPAFGPQKLYSGHLNGKEINITISKRSAPVKITPYQVGFLCGVFQDGIQYKNRYITKFEAPEITVEMHAFTPEQLILDGTYYLEQEGYANYNAESIIDNETDLKKISEKMERYNMQMRGGNSDQMQLYALKMAIEGQRSKAIISGHPERQISEADAGRLIDLKQKIINKRKVCRRLKGTKYEATCRSALHRLERQYWNLYRRLFR